MLERLDSLTMRRGPVLSRRTVFESWCATMVPERQASPPSGPDLLITQTFRRLGASLRSRLNPPSSRGCGVRRRRVTLRRGLLLRAPG
jgi:hypothetical protein